MDAGWSCEVVDDAKEEVDDGSSVVVEVRPSIVEDDDEDEDDNDGERRGAMAPNGNAGRTGATTYDCDDVDDENCGCDVDADCTYD